MTITKEADVIGLYPDGCESMMYYDTGAITNILSFKKLAKIDQITYNSEVSKMFTVHCKSHGLVDLHFTMHPCSIHILEQENAGSMFIQTVEDNLKFYNKRQIAGASQAKNLYDNLLCLSVEDIHNIISTGGIQGCQVSVEDVTTAMKIWGPSVTKAKGNTVRQPAKPSPTSIVSVPKELPEAQKKVTLSINFSTSTRSTSFL